VLTLFALFGQKREQHIRPRRGKGNHPNLEEHRQAAGPWNALWAGYDHTSPGRPADGTRRARRRVIAHSATLKRGDERKASPAHGTAVSSRTRNRDKGGADRVFELRLDAPGVERGVECAGCWKEGVEPRLPASPDERPDCRRDQRCMRFGRRHPFACFACRGLLRRLA